MTASNRGCAIIFGGTGGIGAALVAALHASEQYEQVLAFGRRTGVPIELTDEASLAAAVEHAAAHGEIRLAIDATGMLHTDAYRPEKSWRELDAGHLAASFAINAIGPALLMKHLLPRLPREGRAVFATLSARVGSIGDNRLGGWYGYRAAKAALNQFLHTAAIELARRAPQAICVALHPGSVATPLSAPFARPDHPAQTPQEAAAHLLAVIDRLTPEQTGSFVDWRGETIPW